MTSAREDPSVARLLALTARMRSELDELRHEAAGQATIDLARGILMERLHCSAVEARAQLTRIAEATGMSRMELAAQVTGLGLAADPKLPAAGPAGPDFGGCGTRGGTGQARAAAAADQVTTCSALAAAVLEEALSDTGAVAVAIWLIAPDAALELAGQAGFSPGEQSRWRRIPPGIAVPPERAAREHAESWWPSGPPDAERAALIGGQHGGARAVVPIVAAGATLGALEVCWAEPIGEFAASLRRRVTGVADVCAAALRAGRLPGGLPPAGFRDPWILELLGTLADSALFARPIRAPDGEAVDFRLDWVSAGFADPSGRTASELTGMSLLEAFPATAGQGGLLDRAATAMRTSQPVIGTGPEGRIVPLYDGVAIAWRPAGRADRLAALLEHAQRLGRIGAWEEAPDAAEVRWSEPTFALFGKKDGPVALADLDRWVADEDKDVVRSFRRRLQVDLQTAAAVFRIVRADDGSTRQIRAFAEPVLDSSGQLASIRGAYQDVSAHYHTEVALAATRDQLSDSEERAAEERRLAVRLQAAITPLSSSLVPSDQLDVAARYRPAGEGHLVSGDWYDVVQLPDECIMLVVGDVAGHGIDAVTGMVALRNGLRGLALTGAGPGTLLGWLNGTACHLTDDIIGTVVCGIYDPGSRVLRWARAGHFPPILVRAGAASQLPAPAGLLLGADPEAVYEETSIQLRADDTLVLFTDGLIERRNEPIDVSLRSLLEIAARPMTDIDSYADALVAESGSDTGDDACVVTISIR